MCKEPRPRAGVLEDEAHCTEGGRGPGGSRHGVEEATSGARDPTSQSPRVPGPYSCELRSMAVPVTVFQGNFLWSRRSLDRQREQGPFSLVP